MGEIPDGLVDNVIDELLRRGITYIDVTFGYDDDDLCREQIRNVIDALFESRLPLPLRDPAPPRYPNG